MILRLILIGVILFAVFDVHAAEPNSAPVTGTSDTRLDAIDNMLTSFVADRKIPGVAMAMSRGGKLVYARGVGYSDVEAQQPVQPDSLFRIASISKPITAVAIMQFVERGKLSLDDRCFEILTVEPYLPEGKTVDPRLKTITVRQLLQHTGGWDRDKSFDAMFRPVQFARAIGVEPPAGPWTVIRYMSSQPLDFEPGERYAYSNYGYCLLGRIIEKLSGQSYEDYVREHVLKPVGITRMRIGKTLAAGRAEGEVKYYEKDATGPSVFGPEFGKPVPQPYGAWHLEAMDAHGGWIASAVDLVRFASAFDDPAHCKLLKPESIAAMFARPPGKPGLNAEGKPADFYYACGWMSTVVEGDSRTNRWHTGSLPGTSTICVHRHDGYNWAVLFNTRNDDRKEVPSRKIDPLVHQVVNDLKDWPTTDRFVEFR